jgi:TRAP-type C4-dicarboxylate transport system permease small subunit
MALLRTLERVFVRTNEVVVVLLMMVMTALVLLNVITRYGFQFSVTWAEELSRFVMIWVTYIGAGLALRQGNHVAFEYVQSLLPPRVVPWLRAAIAVAILVFLAYLTWFGWEFSQLTMRQRSAVLGVPRGMVGLAIPIGATVLGMHLLMTFRQFMFTNVRDDPLSASVASSTPLVADGGTGETEVRS